MKEQGAVAKMHGLNESSPLMTANWEGVDPGTLSKLCSEARREIETQLQSADSIDSKAIALLGAGSLVSALIGAMQLSMFEPARLPGLCFSIRLAASVLTIILFIAWFVPTLLTILTYAFKTTLQIDEEHIVENYLSLTPELLDRQLFYNYVQAIRSNDQILRRKGWLSNLATYLLAANVFYLLVVSVLLLLGRQNVMAGG